MEFLVLVQHFFGLAYVFTGAVIGCFGVVLMPPVLKHWTIKGAAGLLFGGVLTAVIGEAFAGDGSKARALFIGTLMVGAWAYGWTHVALRRWWYHLTPHPAAEAVTKAVGRGEQLDAAAMQALATAGSTGDPFRDEILAEQARALTQQWRQHEGELAQEEARILAAETARLAKQNELAGAQRDLVEAALAHERRAARVAELQRQAKSQ